MAMFGELFDMAGAGLSELFGSGAAESAVAGSAMTAEEGSALHNIGSGMVNTAAPNGGMVSQVVSPSGASTVSPFLPGWAGDALGPLMKSITGVALRPGGMGGGVNAPMPGAGRGVNASAASNGQVISELGKASGGDPLNGLSGFKNLL